MTMAPENKHASGENARQMHWHATCHGMPWHAHSSFSAQQVRIEPLNLFLPVLSKNLSVAFGSLRSGSVRFGSARFGLVRFGSAVSGSRFAVWFAAALSNIGSVHFTGSVRFAGSVRFRFGWFHEAFLTRHSNISVPSRFELNL